MAKCVSSIVNKFWVYEIFGSLRPVFVKFRTVSQLFWDQSCTCSLCFRSQSGDESTCQVFGVLLFSV